MYYYFLDPAKCWNSFSNLDMTIKIPNNYHIDDNNLKLKYVGSNTYKFYSEKLPNGNFQFTVRYNETFLLGWEGLFIVLILILVGIISLFAFFVYCIVMYIRQKRTEKIT